MNLTWFSVVMVVVVARTWKQDGVDVSVVVVVAVNLNFVSKMVIL